MHEKGEPKMPDCDPTLFLLAAPGVSRGALLEAMRLEKRGEATLAEQAAAYRRQSPRNAEAAEGLALAWAADCMDLGYTWVSWLDAHYPALLTENLGNDAPPVLFLGGNAALLDRPAISIAGTRRPSKEGERNARELASGVVRRGNVVVSGGAMGVDTAARNGALEAGGATIVVLPEGLLGFMHPDDWFRALREKRILLLSEFVPCAPWADYAAVTRNATLSALGRAVCIVEPGQKRGGSLRTARCGLEQGKPVFVAGPPPDYAVPAELAAAGAEPLDVKRGAPCADRVLEAAAADRPLPNDMLF